MTRILLGPAGTPKGSTLEGIRYLPEIGLQAMECEFVYGVNMTNATAKKIGIEAKKYNIELSIHSPYYINLASDEKKKVMASKRWILLSCERAHYLNAKTIVFHPGFYGRKSPEETFEVVCNELEDIKKWIKEHKWGVILAPETTGKLSAFGNLDETIALAQKLKCSLCIDFAHLYARNQGKIDYHDVLKKIDSLHLKHLHSHFSCIEYSSKGERRHLNIDANKPSFKELAKEILKNKLDITIICESPRQYLDSLDMKKILEKVGYHFK